MVHYLRATIPAVRPEQVDAAAGEIRGFVVAEAMEFTDGRGRFTVESLRQIVLLWPTAGLKCRFGHPTIYNDGGLVRLLGRAFNPRVDGGCVRADLRLNPTSFGTPSGDLGGYVLNLAKNDPGALMASLVLDSNELPGEWGGPSVWMPTKLHAVDLVDEGAATVSLFTPSGSGLSRPSTNGGRLTAIYRRKLAEQERRIEGVSTGILRRKLNDQVRRMRPFAG